MTSTNDGKDVKSNQTSGQKGKKYYIELYNSLDARLNSDCALRARTAHLCSAWACIHSICRHALPASHPLLLAWLERHTARIVLQTEWQSPTSKDEHDAVTQALNSVIQEIAEAASHRNGNKLPWEDVLEARANWFKGMLSNPWDHPVLRVLLDPRETAPSDDDVIEWLKGERDIVFVTRLRQLVASKCDDLATSLATAVMDRARAGRVIVPDAEQAEEQKDKAPPPEPKTPKFEDRLRAEAGFSEDIWALLTDMELVLLLKVDRRSRCIELAKHLPLRNGYELIQRLQKRLENAKTSRDKKLWKNATEVSTLIAQVVIARCMVISVCSGVSRGALYWSARALASLLDATQLRRSAVALAAPATTSHHLYWMAKAVYMQKNTEEMKPFVCELYVRAITFGMNELEKLKLDPQKEPQARLAEQTLATWFLELGGMFASVRLKCECTLTAFSVHPSPDMYKRIKEAPDLPMIALDPQDAKDEVKSEFGSWATDSRTQTNFVKTSEHLKMKQSQQQANVLSTAILTEGEALGLEVELCQDIAVLLSGPRVKTLSWDMDRTLLLENCRQYMERTGGGTRALTTELKFLNINPDDFQHLPEEDDDENDLYYGIEKGYEHLVEFQEPEPETIWDDIWESEAAFSSGAESNCTTVSRRKKKGVKLQSDESEEGDPLSLIAADSKKKKERPHSKERSKEKRKQKKETSTEAKKEKKEKKERKKKEKTSSKVIQTPSSLSNLVGIKVSRVDDKTLVAVTEAAHDSQGKVSVKSEDVDPNVIYDGHFSMEELKSPERRMSGEGAKTSLSSLHGAKVQKAETTTKQKSNVNVKKPTYYGPNEDVKRRIAKLLQFRRKKMTNPPTTVPQVKATQDTVKTELSSLVGSKISQPTESSICETSKSTMTKKQTEQLSVLSREVSDMLASNKIPTGIKIANSNKSYDPPKNNDTCSRTLPIRQDYVIRKPVPNLNSFQDASLTQPVNLTKKVNVSGNTDHLKQQNLQSPPNLQIQPSLQNKLNEQNLPNVQNQFFNTLASNIPVGPLAFDVQQKNFQQFLKELQGSNIPGKDKPKDNKVHSRKMTPVIVNNPEHSESSPSAKAKKGDTAPNTFARLSYMHKKQGENKPKQINNELNKMSLQSSISAELDQRVADFHKLKNLHNKGIIISQVRQQENPRVEVQNIEEAHDLSRVHPLLTNMLNSNPATVLKPIRSLNENPANSLHIKSSTASENKSTLSEKDQQDLLFLLRQKAYLNESITQKKLERVIQQNNITARVSQTASNSNDALNLPNSSSVSQSSPSIPSVIQNKVSIISGADAIRTADMIQQNKTNIKCKPEQNIKKDLQNSADETLPKPVNVIKKFNKKPNSNKDDWTKVLDAIRAQKTPSRGPNALDMVIKKETYEKFVKDTVPSKNAHENVSTDYVKPQTPGIIKHSQVLNPVKVGERIKISANVPNTVANTSTSQQTNFCREPHRTDKPVEKHQKKKQRTSRTPKISNSVNIPTVDVQGKKPVTKQNISNAKTKINIVEPIEVTRKPNESTKSYPSDIFKRNVDQSKTFLCDGPKEDDPFISGLQNADYDLLEELMDDELRKEIGELSDEERLDSIRDALTCESKSGLNPKPCDLKEPLQKAISKDEPKIIVDIRGILNKDNTTQATTTVAKQPVKTNKIQVVETKVIKPANQKTVKWKPKSVPQNQQPPTGSTAHKPKVSPSLPKNAIVSPKDIIVPAINEEKQINRANQGNVHPNSHLQTPVLNTPQTGQPNVSNTVLLTTVTQPLIQKVVVLQNNAYSPYAKPQTAQNSQMHTNIYIPVDASPNIQFQASVSAPTCIIVDKTSLPVPTASVSFSGLQQLAEAANYVTSLSNHTINFDTNEDSKLLTEQTNLEIPHNIKNQNIEPNITTVEITPTNIYKNEFKTDVNNKDTTNFDTNEDPKLLTEPPNPEIPHNIENQNIEPNITTLEATPPNIYKNEFKTDVNNKEKKVYREQPNLEPPHDIRKLITENSTVVVEKKDTDKNNRECISTVNEELPKLATKQLNLYLPNIKKQNILSNITAETKPTDINKNERKVLSQMQDKLEITPEKIDLKQFESSKLLFENELINNNTKDQERMKRKRSAIINREVSQRCFYPPIPLMYASLKDDSNHRQYINSGTINTHDHDSTSQNSVEVIRKENVLAKTSDCNVARKPAAKTEIKAVRTSNRIRNRKSKMNNVPQSSTIKSANKFSMTTKAQQSNVDCVTITEKPTKSQQEENTKLVTIKTPNTSSHSKQVIKSTDKFKPKQVPIIISQTEKLIDNLDLDMVCESEEPVRKTSTFEKILVSRKPVTKDKLIVPTISSSNSELVSKVTENLSTKTITHKTDNKCAVIEATSAISKSIHSKVFSPKSDVDDFIKELQPIDKIVEQEHVSSSNTCIKEDKDTKSSKCTSVLTDQTVKMQVSDNTYDRTKTSTTNAPSDVIKNIQFLDAAVKQVHVLGSKKDMEDGRALDTSTPLKVQAVEEKVTRSAVDISKNVTTKDPSVLNKTFEENEILGNLNTDNVSALDISNNITTKDPSVMNKKFQENEILGNLNTDEVIVIDSPVKSKATNNEVMVIDRPKAGEALTRVTSEPARNTSMNSDHINDEVTEDFKKKIKIEEIPRSEWSDPYKRLIRIRLPNGKTFKAKIFGTVPVSFETLFSDPSFREILSTGFRDKKNCTLTVQNYAMPNQTIVPKITEVKSSSLKPSTKSVETVNLISDDEEDEQSSAFTTEYGKYFVKSIAKDVVDKHQIKFSQKCFVKVPKLVLEPQDKPIAKEIIINPATDFTQTSVIQSLVEAILKDAPLLQKKTCLNTKTPTEVIEIDDSSNDSIVPGVSSTPTQITELTSLLLADLGVNDVILKNSNSPITSNSNKINTEHIEKKVEVVKDESLKKVVVINAVKDNPPQKMEITNHVPKKDEILVEDEPTKNDYSEILSRQCFIKLSKCDHLLKTVEYSSDESDFGELLIPDSDRDDIIVNDYADSRSSRCDSVSLLHDHNELLISYCVNADSDCPTSPVMKAFETFAALSEVPSQRGSCRTSPVMVIYDMIANIKNKATISETHDGVAQKIQNKTDLVVCKSDWCDTKRCLHRFCRVNHLSSALIKKNFNVITEFREEIKEQINLKKVYSERSFKYDCSCLVTKRIIHQLSLPYQIHSLMKDGNASHLTKQDKEVLSVKTAKYPDTFVCQSDWLETKRRQRQQSFHEIKIFNEILLIKSNTNVNEIEKKYPAEFKLTKILVKYFQTTNIVNYLKPLRIDDLNNVMPVRKLKRKMSRSFDLKSIKANDKFADSNSKGPKKLKVMSNEKIMEVKWKENVEQNVLLDTLTIKDDKDLTFINSDRLDITLKHAPEANSLSIDHDFLMFTTKSCNQTERSSPTLLSISIDSKVIETNKHTINTASEVCKDVNSFVISKQNSLDVSEILYHENKPHSPTILNTEVLLMTNIVSDSKNETESDIGSESKTEPSDSNCGNWKQQSVKLNSDKFEISEGPWTTNKIPNIESGTILDKSIVLEKSNDYVSKDEENVALDSSTVDLESSSDSVSTTISDLNECIPSSNIGSDKEFNKTEAPKDVNSEWMESIQTFHNVLQVKVTKVCEAEYMGNNSACTSVSVENKPDTTQVNSNLTFPGNNLKAKNIETCEDNENFKDSKQTEDDSIDEKQVPCQEKNECENKEASNYVTGVLLEAEVITEEETFSELKLHSETKVYTDDYKSSTTELAMVESGKTVSFTTVNDEPDYCEISQDQNRDCSRNESGENINSVIESKCKISTENLHCTDISETKTEEDKELNTENHIHNVIVKNLTLDAIDVHNPLYSELPYECHTEVIEERLDSLLSVQSVELCHNNQYEDIEKANARSDNHNLEDPKSPHGNGTVVYKEDSGVVIKGVEYEDPEIGTLYVFPLVKSSDSSGNSDVTNSSGEYQIEIDNQDSFLEDCFKLIEPKLTYSKQKRKRKSTECYIKDFDIKRFRKSPKAKKKAKKIDYRKITATSISQACYASEFNRLLDYHSTIKFSYSILFDREYIDVLELVKNWPSMESNIENRLEEENEFKERLFVDFEQSNTLLFDPLSETLGEEIGKIYCSEPSDDETEENNFKMGFGEGSGRVKQNLMNFGAISEFSAATLSDVKQSQPFLLSENCVTCEKSCSQDDQVEKIKRYINNIRLKDKVRSFFKKSSLELNREYDNCIKKRKEKGFPFDLFITNNLQPSQIESVVQVVQVGQLPVSAAAQNPVSCDPRVTQVSDASPSQCNVENGPHDESQSGIKTEYTELTTADLSVPMQNYGANNQPISSMERQETANMATENLPLNPDLIKSEVKIELIEESDETQNEYPKAQDSTPYNDLEQQSVTSNHINNNEYSFNTNSTFQTEPDSNASLIFTSPVKEEPAEQTTETNESMNGVPEKNDQIGHAMNAAGISTSVAAPPPRAHTLVNILSQKIRQNVQNVASTPSPAPTFQKTPVNAMSLQQALAQILPPPLNQASNIDTNNHHVQTQPMAPQVLHIVQGKNASGNQITLLDSSQHSVINTPNATPVLHIVQNKTAVSGAPSNVGQNTQQNTFSGLSLVDAGLQQGGNQLLHIVNTGTQKNNAAGQLLKRVNLLTNIANVQGSNEQKMVQFVCKSADGKAIQLNAPAQRGMVLRLQPIETPNIQTVTQKPTENQELNQTPTNGNSTTSKETQLTPQQEIKSRSVYEENYAKFIQNSTQKPQTEKSTSLPKFNQAFGKPVFQEESQKSEINSNSNHLPVGSNAESSDCPPAENSQINLEHLTQLSSPPLLLRKTTTQNTHAQQNLVHQIKQTIAPMNIQTMHGGVIYTRQIPVNIGGGQTINLITVPTTELIDDKQQGEGKFSNQGEIEPSIIKIVPQTQTATQEMSSDGQNNTTTTNENLQPQPVLTQMRIKLPMLSKAPQMVAGARVVRPSFFQIQRNVISGTNQPVYQQLVLTTAPSLGQQTIRLPQAQTRPIKVPSESQSSTESMSSSTLEQLREFDMVLEQVKERSTVQPNSNSNFKIASTDATDSAVSTPPTETTQQVLYSFGTNQSLNVAYVNRKATVATPLTSAFVRSPDSSGIADSPTSSTHMQVTHAESSGSDTPAPKPHKSKKSRSKSSSHISNSLKINSVPPKTSTQKPLEDEQTTQRILYILAEYKEQVENSPDKDKPAPRRRSNPPTSSGSSKRKKSSSGSRRNGRDLSPSLGEDTSRTMGSEDSSCGTSQGDCAENCLEPSSPQDSPRKVVRKLTFEQEQALNQSKPQQQRNVIVADGQTITVARGTAGKPATAVLMPTNYILPVSMVKGGQQIAIVTNRGPKLLTVGGGEGGATNAVLLQRLIGPAGLKPVLARPGVRHVRLPTTALHNLQAFNIATTTTIQPPDSTASPAPVPTPPELVETRAENSPWPEESKPDRTSSPEGSEPWNLPSSADPQDYSYEETVRTDNLDRTVLDPIPDRYSPDMEAQRIFDKMFDVESKKSYIVDSHDDSPRCGYDIEASDDDKGYQVVHKKDGSHRQHRLAHVSAAALRHKYAILEHELRLQKSLSEECEDLGVDSPSAAELFPEAELLFASSPAQEHHHEQAHHPHTPQPLLSQSVIQPDIDDQIATDQLLPRNMADDHRQDLDVNLGLEDVGIVTVSEDGMQATIALDQEEFARSHPNTTFHSEPTDDGEVQPFTITTGVKSRQISSTIFHSNRAPATVLMTAPQTSVISQAAGETSQNHIKYDLENMMHSMPGSHANHVNLSSVLVNKDENLTRYDNILNDNRELHFSNTASAIVHATSNATQVIRRVCYDDDKRERERYLMDEPEGLIAGEDAKMISDDATLGSMVDDVNSSPERHTELFWESNSASERSESRRPLDFSSDSDKCCKSPSYDETNSTDSSGVGTHMRLDSVIKDARGIERSGSAGSSADDTHPPLRTYPPKRSYHTMEDNVERSLSGKTRAGERSPDNLEVRRRASGRGVVKRGCHCCNGSPAPPRPKKPRQRKPTTDFNAN